MPWFDRLTRPAGAITAFLLLAVLVNAPYLFGGFQADDIIFLNMLERDPLPFQHWKGLWSTADVPAFQAAWWRSPDALGTFWRPLPSLLIVGSVRLFGEHAFPLHLCSLLLHGGVAATLVLLLRRLGLEPLLALLSGLLFLLCEDHSMGVGWIATITDMMCVQLALLALLAHLRWLQERRGRWMGASLLAVVLAMGCKESAVVAPVVLVITTGLFPTGRLGEGRLLTRVVQGIKDVPSWAPQLAILPAYLIFYKLAGMGGMNNLLYLDPLADPGPYALRLFTHLPPLWLASLTPMMISLVLFEPALRAPLAICGACSFVSLLLMLRPLRSHPLVPWGLGLYLLTLLPQIGADGTERALYLPTVFLAPVLALLLVQVGFIARRLQPTKPLAPLTTRIGGGWVLAVVLGLGAILSAAYPWMFLPSLQAPEREVGTALPVLEEHQPERVAVLTTSGMMMTLYAPDVLLYVSGQDFEVGTLSSGHGVWSVERLDERSLRLRTDRPGWLNNMFALMMRSEPLLEPSSRHDGPFFDVTLEELTPDRRDLLAARFEFSTPLDDPGLLLLAWDGERYVRIDPTSLEPGEAVPLVDNADVWASM